MTNRPKIPAEVEREILVECGHRCAVDGTPIPLERAHIIPWHKSKEHKAEDMICLCANCHERADREKWDEKTFRKYKYNPWIQRQYKTENHDPSPTTKVELIIDMELEQFDETYQRLLRYALAAFLGVSEHVIRIKSIRRGSVKVTIELPMQNAEELLSAYKRNDSELVKYCAQFTLLHAHGKEFVDDKKLEELIAKYYEPISALVRRKIARREDVEDIVQETFANTYLRELEAPYGYLQQVASRLIATFYKQTKRPVLLSGDIEKLLCDTIDPGQLFEHKDLLVYLRQKIEMLPHNQKEIIKLRYFNDPPLTWKAIGKIFNYSLPTVAIKYNRAIIKLRKEIMRPLD